MKFFRILVKSMLFCVVLLAAAFSTADVEKGIAALNNQDPDTAFSEFRKAHKSGDVTGTLYLGRAYFRGIGVPADKTYGISLIRSAAEDGLADAEFEMAVAYLFGAGVEQNSETSTAWYQRAAKQEHAGAQLMLGYAYRDGAGVAVDGAKAEHYFNLAAPSNPKALMEIGVMYYTGKAVPQDLKKALAAFRRGADRDHPHSVYWLSYLYRYGEGVPADHEKHLEYLEQAANLGSSRAQHEMGELFAWPHDEDPAKAVYWFEKAALAGYKDAITDLMYALESADWTPETEKGRVYWIKTAADSGIAQQQWNYAQLLMRGEEVPRDRTEAQRYLMAAAEGGFKTAQLIVGQAYYEGGLGLSIDHKKGYEMMRGAALQYVPEAMKAMAIIHSSGAGADEDAFVAYVWLLHAEEQGANDLQSLRRHLIPRLDGALIHIAKARVEGCSNLEHCTRPRSSW